MSESPVVIRVRDLHFRYNGMSVIEGVDLDVRREDFLGIVGPNGGGKTTLVKLILGLLKPWSGTVEVFGETPRKARTQIGYVPQYAQFDSDFPVTVKEMVLMGRVGNARIGRRYGKEDHGACERVLEQMGLVPLENRPIHDLSGGERQRAMVARALVSDPGVLLLDEPTASVDSRMEKQFYDDLRALNEKIPIILVSHDLGFISAYVTRVACLNRRLVVNPVSEVHAHDLEALYDAPVKLWSHDCEL